MSKKYYGADDVKVLKVAKSDDMEITPDEWRFVRLVGLMVLGAIVAALFVWTLFLRPASVGTEKLVYVPVTLQPTVTPDGVVLELSGRGDDLVAFSLAEDTGVVVAIARNNVDYGRFEMAIRDQDLSQVRMVKDCDMFCDGTTRKEWGNLPAGDYVLYVISEGSWRLRLENPRKG